MAAITLGMVGPKRYADRVARKEAFNHAGNAVNAALSAALGYIWGLGYVAAAIGVMAIATGGVVLTVDPRSINHEVARGGDARKDSTLRTLRGKKTLLLVAATAFAFQAANGALLPFIAQALTAKEANPSLTTGAMTVAAQISMVGAAALVPRLSRYAGHDLVFGLALLGVVLRAVLASASMNYWSIGAVQILEGLSMGLAGVAIPAIVAKVMSNTGHATAGLGSVMLAFGAGAALSPALTGLIAQFFGFQASFLALGVVAALGLAGWIVGLRRQAGHQQRKCWTAGSLNRAEP
jgi:predicted MFS family arabinose efflux permease